MTTNSFGQKFFDMTAMGGADLSSVSGQHTRLQFSEHR